MKEEQNMTATLPRSDASGCSDGDVGDARSVPENNIKTIFPRLSQLIDWLPTKAERLRALEILRQREECE